MQVNKQCPVLLDTETRLDSTGTNPGRVVIYYLTLTQQLKANINIEEVRQFLTYQIIINNIRTNEQMKFMRDNDVTFDYKYQDKDFTDVLDIVVKNPV